MGTHPPDIGDGWANDSFRDGDGSSIRDRCGSVRDSDRGSSDAGYGEFRTGDLDSLDFWSAGEYEAVEFGNVLTVKTLPAEPAGSEPAGSEFSDADDATTDAIRSNVGLVAETIRVSASLDFHAEILGFLESREDEDGDPGHHEEHVHERS